MNDSEDAQAPHAAAEADTRDPSRAANQPQAEPVPPRGNEDAVPTADTNQPDSAGAASATTQQADRPQAGVPESTVTDTTPALGTSEAMPPVQGQHTPASRGDASDTT